MAGRPRRQELVGRALTGACKSGGRASDFRRAPHQKKKEPRSRFGDGPSINLAAVPGAMPRSTRGVALRAAAFIALTALLARASPAPLDCCGDGSCALECTEGCAAAECAACCDPCAGVVCPPPTAQCKAAGTCSGGTCSTPNAAEGTACDYTASGGDGACVAGACVPAAPAGAWAAVCGGVQFGCGLDAAGRAWCWGTDTSGFGFLGQGATATQTLQFPSPVVGGHLFASITCGYIYVCALTPSGAAYCWGARRRA